MEVSTLNFVVSAIGVAFTYGLFIWGFWLGWKGLTADHEAHVDFGHAYGAPGTFDPRYHPPIETDELKKAA